MYTLDLNGFRLIICVFYYSLNGKSCKNKSSTTLLSDGYNKKQFKDMGSGV